MSKVKTETAKTVKTIPVSSKKKQCTVMYLGPTITGVVRHSTIFKDGVLPERVKECISQLPMIERLFVSLDKLPEAKKELNKKQSVLCTIYAQTVNKFIKEVSRNGIYARSKDSGESDKYSYPGRK